MTYKKTQLDKRPFGVQYCLMIMSMPTLSFFQRKNKMKKGGGAF